ncbi:putative Gag-pol polyprotein, partial [Gregarina niphandrodes]
GGEQAFHRARHAAWTIRVNVIPFGIKNSPAEFQRAMDMVFEEVLDDRTLCYTDDIIIATNTVPEMMQRLEKVLRLCRERGFYLRLDKSECLKPELLKKGRLFVWPDARREAFMKLKRAVAGASFLHKPVPGAPLIIETDASEVGIGAVLKQVQEVPLEFASKKFTEAERKWDTRETELFAVKWAVEKWCDYVALHHFTVRTDHANLRYLVGVDKGKVCSAGRWRSAGSTSL